MDTQSPDERADTVISAAIQRAFEGRGDRRLRPCVARVIERFRPGFTEHLVDEILPKLERWGHRAGSILAQWGYTEVLAFALFSVVLVYRGELAAWTAAAWVAAHALSWLYYRERWLRLDTTRNMEATLDLALELCTAVRSEARVSCEVEDLLTQLRTKAERAPKQRGRQKGRFTGYDSTETWQADMERTLSRLGARFTWTELADELGVNWRTAKGYYEHYKALQSGTPPEE